MWDWTASFCNRMGPGRIKELNFKTREMNPITFPTMSPFQEMCLLSFQGTEGLSSGPRVFEAKVISTGLHTSPFNILF